MADFKLTEVAKKIGLTAEQALEKLTDAGESVAGTGANISVEQMRILGVEPQQMIDRRRERLQQVLERRTRGSMGKEVVVDSRSKNEPAAASAAPTRKISREELLKRKSELNKDVQKVDEERQLRIKADEEAETALADTDAAIETEAPAAAEPVEQELPKTEPAEQEKPVVNEKPVVKEKSAVAKEKPAEKEKPASVEKPVEKEKSAEHAKKTPRPAGPAGYVPRTDQQGRTQRPSGPAAMRSDRPDRGGRPERPDRGDRPDRGGRPDRGPADRGDRPDRARSGSQRPTGAGGLAPKSEHLVPRTEDERRRGEKKKEVDPSIAAKEEAAKKAKAKVADPKKARDWNKTINEGMEELDIELEIEAPAENAAAMPEVPQVQPQARGGRPERKMKKKDQRTTPPPTPKPTHITIGETITVADLAGMIAIKATELVKKLFAMGIMATVNQAIDAETATLLSMEYGVEVSTKVLTEDDLLPVYEDKPEDLERRPPVVTVMGHVDHGKTSLLDAIRSTSVASKEAGGITQHIGAYEAELDGRKITFLDTPGHEAFTSLRARGAQATDIVILVVAANDGVMPQTKEAIDHAKAAGVKIVVAINKIDADNANPDRVRQQLADYGIISDEWGGEHQFQEISAKKNIGIKDLLERVLLEADILELTGNPKRPAEGIVIESQLDKQKGPVATILVRNGTLHRGDTFLVGSQVAKVRSMYNYRGQVVKEAGISMPVEVMGFSSVPEAGDKILAISDERIAKSIADIRARYEQAARHSTGNVISLTDFFNMVKQGEIKELNIIIKSDVQGSLEALKSSLLKLTNAEVKVNVVHDATGGITESDVVLAMASKAIIIGFNVRPDTNARNLAEREGVSIELYSVIYKAIEDVKLALEGMLTPDTVERVIGKVEIRQVFSVPKIGKIAGSYVVEGKVTRNSLVRVIRDNVVIYDGKLASLKRFTDDVKEVNQGYECGLSIDKYQDIKEGDFLEVYELVEEKRTLADVAKSEAAKADK